MSFPTRRRFSHTRTRAYITAFMTSGRIVGQGLGDAYFFFVGAAALAACASTIRAPCRMPCRA